MKIIKYPTFEPSACPSCGTVFQVEVGDDIEVRTSATTGEKRHVCYCPSCNVAVHLQALGVVDSQTDDIATDDVAQSILEELQREISDAIDHNYRVRSEHIEKYPHGCNEVFMTHVIGKIDTLRGIDDFIEEPKRKYHLEQEE